VNGELVVEAFEVLILTACAALFVAMLAIVGWRRRHAPRWAVCPEAGCLARVEPAFHRIKACSLWPDRADCAQKCFAEAVQRSVSPARLQVERYYADRSCALCGQRLGMEFSACPLLIGPDNVTHEWDELEDLPKAFATSRPICWDCQIEGDERRLP
jgi:hypothetical protein